MIGRAGSNGEYWPAVVISLAVVVAVTSGPARSNGIAPFEVTGDAVEASLDGKAGDPRRGRDIVLDRQVGNCLICHAVPNEPKEMFQGNIGPSLAGVASRLNVGQIRLRVIDQRRLNPHSVMPSFYRVDGLNRVAARYAGKPVLDAQQIEDVVAYLSMLKE